MKKAILFGIALLLGTSLFGQPAGEKYAQDVQSVAAIIDAYYAVVSGSRNDPWQFERDRFLHSKNAVITRLDAHGYAESHALEAEYIPLALAPKGDFYEIELKRSVSRFGNMAQVWSAFEIRTDPDLETNTRGLNSIQLHYEKGRWWIDSWTCEMASENNPVVTDFLKAE
ncbi:hypothetical protein [Robiginitalea marina]|uniref:DUF4440 domain-containing protein n=1 Tax=Robiginitalea marina TaxID=2954105 RepID=A0ABT1B0E0_9FLAO|nr:hypothetical protein [Robiginitalea marina]MCO5725763.1 hypothetical protein [Robiginitalea marina]